MLRLLVELASNALSDDLLVSPAAAALGRHLRKLVRSSEHASRPAGPAKVDVRVLVHGIELLTKHSEAAGIVRATSLGEDGLALVGTEPSTESVEGVDVVGGASGVSSGSVRVEVLVDIEDQVGGAAIEVLDLGESGARTVGDVSGGVGPLVAGKEDLVGSGTGLADGGHGGLDGGSPGVDGDIVGLVHQAKSDFVVALVLGSDLGPDASEIVVGGSALADDGAVPTGVVVQVDDAEGGAGVQAALDLGIVDLPVSSVQGAADGVDEVLPAHGETEGVEAVVFDEVVHLVETSLARVDDVTRGASTVGAATEVETSDLWDVLVFDLNSLYGNRRTLTPAYWTPPLEALEAVVREATAEGALTGEEVALVAAADEAALVDAALVEAALVGAADADPGTHCEYQSLDFSHLYPETQAVSPEKPWPPHWLYAVAAADAEPAAVTAARAKKVDFMMETVKSERM
jgi:hypothetical protein